MRDLRIKTLTIGQLAQAVGVNIQTVRFYERKGILKPQMRSHSGYRVYDEDSLKRLQFIRQAKDLGFSLDEIRGLLNLRARSSDRCDQVRLRAEQKLTGVKQKIAQLIKLEKVLKGLISDCRNRVLPDRCPIIDKMEV